MVCAPSFSISFLSVSSWSLGPFAAPVGSLQLSKVLKYLWVSLQVERWRHLWSVSHEPKMHPFHPWKPALDCPSLLFFKKFYVFILYFMCIDVLPEFNLRTMWVQYL